MPPTRTPTRAQVTFGDVSMRERERALLLGGTGSGKTTLETLLLSDFYTRYPKSRILILDSKPRFRAEFLVTGIAAKRRYRHWAPDAALPGSVVIDSHTDLDLAWRQSRIVIAQCEHAAERWKLVECAERFYNSAKHTRPQLLCVDETADFFHINGSPIAGSTDALVRIARSGRERGTGALYCSQRARSLPSSIIEEMTQLYLFVLDGEADLKRCVEMGAPKAIQPPPREHEFYLWTKRDRQKIYGPFTVDISG